MKDKETMLKLMRFWLFGTFLIVVVAFTMYAFVITPNLAIFGTVQYWGAIVITAVLCVAGFYIYKWYLNKQE